MGREGRGGGGAVVRGQLAQRAIVCGVIVWEIVVWGTIGIGGSCPEGLPGGPLTWKTIVPGEWSWGLLVGDNCSGGNCPGGIVLERLKTTEL